MEDVHSPSMGIFDCNYLSSRSDRPAAHRADLAAHLFHSSCIELRIFISCFGKGNQIRYTFNIRTDKYLHAYNHTFPPRAGNGYKSDTRSAAFVKLIGIVLRGAQRVKCRKVSYPALPVLCSLPALLKCKF